jgi:hypothetical protein
MLVSIQDAVKDCYNTCLYPKGNYPAKINQLTQQFLCVENDPDPPLSLVGPLDTLGPKAGYPTVSLQMSISRERK